MSASISFHQLDLFQDWQTSLRATLFFYSVQGAVHKAEKVGAFGGNWAKKLIAR